MRKISALDFLNRKNFNVDVYSESGIVLFSLGTEITPDILLHLYFKDIYIKEEDAKKILDSESQLLEEKETLHQNKEKEVGDLLAANASPIITQETESATKTTQIETLEKEEEIQEKQLEFDAELARETADLSVKFAAIIGFSDSELEDIRKAAYYKDIGIKNFKNTDAMQPNFEDKVGILTYNILKEEMHFSEKIAEVAKFYFKDYNVKSFNINPSEPVPYYYLIGITDFYVKMLRKLGKEKTLNKMLKIGGNKFNIFLLHKFINMMGKDNG